MNSITKISLNDSIDDFSDSEGSQHAIKPFVPKGPNLFQQIALIQNNDTKMEKYEEKEPTQKENVSISNSNNRQPITKEFLQNIIKTSKNGRVNKKVNSFVKENNFKQTSQKVFTQESSHKKVTKINQNFNLENTQPKSSKEELKKYDQYKAIYEQKLKEDNNGYDLNKTVNVLKETKKQIAIDVRNSKLQIKSLIFENKLNQKKMAEKARKIQMSYQIDVEDIINSFVYNIFKLAEKDQDKIILALKYYINYEQYYNKNGKDYLKIAQGILLDKFMKLMKGDNYGYFQYRNQNLMYKYYQLKFIDLKVVKYLILYLMYFSTKCLTEQDYFNAEFYINLVNNFMSVFEVELNFNRDICCDIFLNESYINLISIYIENYNNISYFIYDSCQIMKILDELIEEDQFSIYVLINNIFTIYIKHLENQKNKPAILTNLKNSIKKLQKIQLNLKKNQNFCKINYFLNPTKSYGMQSDTLE